MEQSGESTEGENSW